MITLIAIARRFSITHWSSCSCTFSTFVLLNLNLENIGNCRFGIYVHLTKSDAAPLSGGLYTNAACSPAQFNQSLGWTGFKRGKNQYATKRIVANPSAPENTPDTTAACFPRTIYPQRRMPKKHRLGAKILKNWVINIFS